MHHPDDAETGTGQASQTTEGSTSGTTVDFIRTLITDDQRALQERDAQVYPAVLAPGQGIRNNDLSGPKGHVIRQVQATPEWPLLCSVPSHTRREHRGLAPTPSQNQEHP